ncbi:receptor-like protein 19 [Capsicum galapagoense]
MGSLFFFYSLVCFVLLSQNFSSSLVQHLCSPNEAFSLVQFKQQFSASFAKTSWNESRDCCTWDGVTCDMLTGYVIGLDLHLTNLSGSIHPNSSLFQLRHLQTLNFAYNNLSGPIPYSIGNLTQTRELNFGYNHFTGHIPSTISKLKHLTLLDLSSNSLGGEIPDVFSNLQELVNLYLSYNSFIGPFPSSIVRLASLESLDLSSNSLSGPLPSNVSMLQKLVDLDFSHNSLNGTIPSWMFSLLSLYMLELHHNLFNGLSDELKLNPTLGRLDLSHNQLSGPVLRSLQNLTNLVNLDLSSNNITVDEAIPIAFPSLEVLQLSSCELKDLPHFLRNLKTLRALNLSNNKIRGQIPNWFSNRRWDSLFHLNLSHNSLSGHIDLSHYYSLVSLDLKFNFLEGPLPSAICNMSFLNLLDLSRNNFSNSIPSCLGNMTQLTVLDLRRNNFSGSLPPLCTQITSLATSILNGYQLMTTIILNGNRFEGRVPVSWLNCVGLEVLDIGNNAITDTFPASLGTLEELQVLVLKSNKFHGPISTKLKFGFPKLRILDLSHNEFSDSLPAEVFRNFKAMIKDDTNKGEIRYMKRFDSFFDVYEDSVRLVVKGNEIELERITTIMTTIDLSSNHFEGVIPKALKDLGSLWLLNLSHNNLRGDIPMELGRLNMLEALDLSWNRLTGKIPRELTRMNFLAFLNLSQNLLVGPIPRGLQFNTFDNDSYGGNLDLCGPPLTKQCGTSDLSLVPQPLESEGEDEAYFFSGFTWESVVIGYSFGLVVGTVVCSVMLKAVKPKWFVEFFEGLIPHKKRRPTKRAQRRQT